MLLQLQPDKLSAMDFHARQKKLREHLATTRFDALLISHLPNIRYLCGFTGSAGLLLVEEAGSVFFTDVRYDTQAHEEVKAAKVVVARKAVLVPSWGVSRDAAQAGSRMGNRDRGRALYGCRKKSPHAGATCPAFG